MLSYLLAVVAVGAALAVVAGRAVLAVVAVLAGIGAVLAGGHFYTYSQVFFMV